MTTMYPPDWPRCTCGEPVLDGHLTCGRAGCSEVAARDRQQRRFELSDDDLARHIQGLERTLEELRTEASRRRWTRRMPARDRLVEAMRAAARGEPTLGAIAIATQKTGVCDVGERGVCYDVYELLDAPVRNNATTRPGYSFIFQSGRYDGFSPDDVRLMLTLTGEICANVTNYQFTNVLRLERHFAAGVFDAALRVEQRKQKE